MSQLRVVEKIDPAPVAFPSRAIVAHDSKSRRTSEDIGLCGLLAEVLGCQRCSLLVVDQRGAFTVVDAVGVPSSITPGTRLAPGDSISTRVAITGKPWVANDRRRDRDTPSSLGTYMSASFLSFPFEFSNGSLGVFNATERMTGEPFGEHDAEIVRRLCAFYGRYLFADVVNSTLSVEPNQRQVRSREIQAQEEERERIARDLHDDAGHRIVTAMLRLDMAVDKCGSRKEIRSELNQVRQLLQECADGLHEVSFSLRPRILSDLGLVPAIRSLAQRVQDASGLRVCIYVGDVAPRFPETVELAAYRIVQEALTNTIKHAHASQVMITVLQTGAYLKLSITDDGQGFDLGLSVGSQRTRLGLRGMRERAEMIGGMLDIQSTFGLGTSIQAKLPVGEVPS